MPQADPHPHDMADSTVKFYDVSERPPRGGWIAFVYGREYAATTESGVVDAVREDLQNNQRYVNDAQIIAELWRYWCSREPGRCHQPARALAGFTTEQSPAADGSQPADWKTAQGPRLWAKLHYFAVAMYRQGSIDPMAVRRWLELFGREIACEDCRQKWNLENAILPPALGTPTAFFEWTVGIHNAVNSRLGKPQFSLEQAYALYLP